MYTIYTSPGCGPCMTVKAHLRAHKIPHTLVDVSQDPAAVEKLRKMGYFSAPVTVDEATGEHWHGYLPDRYASPAPEAAPAADVQATIDLGPVEAGEHVLWNPRETNLLIVGEPDTGKSALQRGIIESAASVGWQVWGLGLPGELEKVEDHWDVQILTADVADQLERIRAAHELMEQRYHLIEIASLAQEHPETFQPLVLVLEDYGYLHQRWVDLAAAGEQEAAHAEKILLDLHRLGGSVGIHLSVACHGIAHHLGQTMAAGSTVVHTSLWRSSLETEMAHAR